MSITGSGENGKGAINGNECFAPNLERAVGVKRPNGTAPNLHPSHCKVKRYLLRISHYAGFNIEAGTPPNLRVSNASCIVFVVTEPSTWSHLFTCTKCQRNKTKKRTSTSSPGCWLRRETPASLLQNDLTLITQEMTFSSLDFLMLWDKQEGKTTSLQASHPILHWKSLLRWKHFILVFFFTIALLLCDVQHNSNNIALIWGKPFHIQCRSTVLSI